MKILAHTCFIGVTGYANHAKSFFCALNKYHTVKVRNSTIGGGWKGMNNTPHDNEPYITDEMKDMLILQTLINGDGSRSDYPIYDYDGHYVPDVHIVLVDTNNHYFYDDYKGYKIAYNVWESTRYPDNFFQRLHYFDEVWVPTQWQFDCLVEQGYPSHKISIVPEGVDVEIFKPLSKVPKKDKFRFLHFGRWDYRKGTTEVLRTFGEVFSGRTDVEMIVSVENPYPYDGMKTTEERVEFHKINTENIKFIKFTPREEYVKYLQEGDVFVTCTYDRGKLTGIFEAWYDFMKGHIAMRAICRDDKTRWRYEYDRKGRLEVFIVYDNEGQEYEKITYSYVRGKRYEVCVNFVTGRVTHDWSRRPRETI